LPAGLELRILEAAGKVRVVDPELALFARERHAAVQVFEEGLVPGEPLRCIDHAVVAEDEKKRAIEEAEIPESLQKAAKLDVEDKHREDVARVRAASFLEKGELDADPLRAAPESRPLDPGEVRLLEIRTLVEEPKRGLIGFLRPLEAVLASPVGNAHAKGVRELVRGRE
jgi:hypothetical protein